MGSDHDSHRKNKSISSIHHIRLPSRNCLENKSLIVSQNESISAKKEQIHDHYNKRDVSGVKGQSKKSEYKTSKINQENKGHMDEEPNDIERSKIYSTKGVKGKALPELDTSSKKPLAKSPRHERSKTPVYGKGDEFVVNKREMLKLFKKKFKENKEKKGIKLKISMMNSIFR